MARLFNWFRSLFRKESKQTLIDYNVVDQQELIAKSALKLSEHTSSGVYKQLEKVFVASRNIEVMEMGSSKTMDDFNYHRGRLDALQDVVEYFALCKDEQQCEKLSSRGAQKQASIYSMKGRK